MSIDECKIETEKEPNTEDNEEANDQNGKKKPSIDPSNIPRKGYYFEHDTRQDENSTGDKKKNRRTKFNQKFRDNGTINQKWTHDRFDERQQQPKSKNELVKRYGYDIREEKDPESIKPLKKDNHEKPKEESESEQESTNRRTDLPSDSDDDHIGHKLANLRRRKTNMNKNFGAKTKITSKPVAKEQKLENSFKKMTIKEPTSQQPSNQHSELPKRYSSIRNQSSFNPQQINQRNQVQQQSYQAAYQNWQPSFHQNYTTAQIAPPPGLPLPQTQSNNHFYYIQQSDYVAAQEYAAAMAASLISNPVFYSNGHNTAPSPSLSPLANAQPYQTNRQSKAIPIVNPNKSHQ